MAPRRNNLLAAAACAVIVAVALAQQTVAHDDSCRTIKNPNDCFLSQEPRCFWLQANNTCTENKPTARPTLERTRAPTPANATCAFGESTCKETSFCLWLPGVGCRIRNQVPETAAPTGTATDCLSLEEEDCEDARECVFIAGGIGCKPRPAKGTCNDAEEATYRTCSRGIREGVGHLLNKTRKAIDDAPQGQKLAQAQAFWCNVAPQLIVNTTRRCAKSCFADDDDFMGLGDNRDWCADFNNGTSLPEFFDRFNCTTKPTCDEIVATGVAENSELQLALSTGSFASIAQLSTFLASFVLAVMLAVL